jgi:hypothetical protein
MKVIKVGFFSVAFAILLSGCGGTWVDDPSNFERVFGFNKPPEVTVLHSYYWKSSHWTTEYRYFISLKASAMFVNGLTSPQLMTHAESSVKVSGDDVPAWFLTRTLDHYEMWTSINQSGYHIFRDKDDGKIFVYDSQI